VGRSVAPLRRFLLALVVAGAAVGVVLVVVRADDGSGAPDQRGPDPTASGYRIAYDVTDLVAGGAMQEVVEVAPVQGGTVTLPASRLLLPGGGGTATTPSGVYDRVDGTWRQLAAVAPGETGSDLRLTATLAWAEGVGRARRDGTGMVAGLDCIWWLTREPLDAGPVAAATATDRARSCVDADGRLLADTWRAGGTDLRTRTATSVAPLARLDPLDGQSPAALGPQLRTSAVESAQPQGDPPPGCSWTAAARVLEAAPGTTELARTTTRQVADCDGQPVVLDRISGPDVVAPAGDEPLLVGTRQGSARGTAGGVVVELADGEDLLRLRTAAPLGSVLGWLAAQ
jgi:hypothetical protein